MTAPEGDEPARDMQCPFCGHGTKISGIGFVYCGPHKLPDGSYHRAVRMIELSALDRDRKEATNDRT